MKEDTRQFDVSEANKKKAAGAGGGVPLMPQQPAQTPKPTSKPTSSPKMSSTPPAMSAKPGTIYNGWYSTGGSWIKVVQ